MKTVLHILLDADSLTSRILCVLIYILLYDYIYEDYIYQVFGYIGDLDYVKMNVIQYLFWITFSILPIVFYHRINEISTFLCLFIYILVYIPFIHALFITERITTFETYSYASILCTFFILFFQIHRMPILLGIQIKPAIPIYIVELVTLSITLIFIATRASSMHFVNIFTQSDLLYDLRAQNSEKVEERSLILYLQGWLVGAFYPFLLVWYLKHKNYIKAGTILVGYFLLFMVDMQKGTFLMPFLLLAFYFLIKWKQETICNRLHSYIFGGLIILSGTLMIFVDQDNKLLFTISTFVLLRTVCVSGWLTQLYIHFFQENPYTYYTHINIVNAITNAYPYDVPLGMAVAHNSQNANATFFLTEGVASWGIIGVAITGFLFLFFLYLINSITFRYQKNEIFAMFIPTLFSLLNASIFSTMLTGGLFILIFLLASYNPLECEDKNIEIGHNK